MIGAKAGELHKGEYVTVIMTDECLTIGQFQQGDSLYGWANEWHDIDPSQ